MSVKITNFSGEVKGLARRGREPGEVTLALQAAIAASARDGKGKRWEGAANAKDYGKNAQKVRLIANKYVTPEAPLGYSIHTGRDGTDLTFICTVKEAAEEAKGEVAPVVPSPPAKKAPTKKAAAAK